MRIACVGYRDWAVSIYMELRNQFPEYEFLMQLSKSDFCQEQLEKFKPSLILFYGWSDIVEPKFINDHKCLMLHPSPLPKYRGGSPIQNQIINGELDSAVTIFLMNEGIDSGPIAKQKYMSLEGELEDIFKRMEVIGVELTRDILVNGLMLTDQNETEATYFRRRTILESEITLEELSSQTSTYLNNKVRMLQDPYPNAFIRTKDGKKLLIKMTEIKSEP